MGKLESLVVGVSPLTNRIYAGYKRKNEQSFSSKVDVTDSAIGAVAEHLRNEEIKNEDFGGYQFESGTLRWITADAPAVIQNDETEVERLRQTIALYDAAADKFIKKVETGRAQSRETYADLKSIRQREHESSELTAEASKKNLTEADKRGLVALETSCLMRLHDYSAESINRVCDDIMSGTDPKEALIAENQLINLNEGREP